MSINEHHPLFWILFTHSDNYSNCHLMSLAYTSMPIQKKKKISKLRWHFLVIYFADIIWWQIDVWNPKTYPAPQKWGENRLTSIRITELLKWANNRIGFTIYWVKHEFMKFHTSYVIPAAGIRSNKFALMCAIQTQLTSSFEWKVWYKRNMASLPSPTKVFP